MARHTRWSHVLLARPQQPSRALRPGRRLPDAASAAVVAHQSRGIFSAATRRCRQASAIAFRELPTEPSGINLRYCSARAYEDCCSAPTTFANSRADGSRKARPGPLDAVTGQWHCRSAASSRPDSSCRSVFRTLPGFLRCALLYPGQPQHHRRTMIGPFVQAEAGVSGTATASGSNRPQASTRAAGPKPGRRRGSLGAGLRMPGESESDRVEPCLHPPWNGWIWGCGWWRRQRLGHGASTSLQAPARTSAVTTECDQQGQKRSLRVMGTGLEPLGWPWAATQDCISANRITGGRRQGRRGGRIAGRGDLTFALTSKQQAEG